MKKHQPTSCPRICHGSVKEKGGVETRIKPRSQNKQRPQTKILLELLKTPFPSNYNIPFPLLNCTDNIYMTQKLKLVFPPWKRRYLIAYSHSKTLNRTRTLVPVLTPAYSQHWLVSLSASHGGYKYTVFIADFY